MNKLHYCPHQFSVYCACQGEGNHAYLQAVVAASAAGHTQLRHCAGGVPVPILVARQSKLKSYDVELLSEEGVTWMLGPRFGSSGVPAHPEPASIATGRDNLRVIRLESTTPTSGRVVAPLCLWRQEVGSETKNFTAHLNTVWLQ